MTIDQELPKDENVMDYAVAEVNIERIQRKNMKRLASLEKVYSKDNLRPSSKKKGRSFKI